MSTTRRYSLTHEWVTFLGAIAVVGISDHAQDALGEITYVELPTIGLTLKAGDACCVIEGNKSAVDIHSPVSGKIIEVNNALTDTPDLVNRSPYQDGWIFRLTVDPADLSGLMDEEEYQRFLMSV